MRLQARRDDALGAANAPQLALLHSSKGGDSLARIYSPSGGAAPPGSAPSPETGAGGTARGTRGGGGAAAAAARASGRQPGGAASWPAGDAPRPGPGGAAAGGPAGLASYREQQNLWLHRTKELYALWMKQLTNSQGINAELDGIRAYFSELPSVAACYPAGTEARSAGGSVGVFPRQPGQAVSSGGAPTATAAHMPSPSPSNVNLQVSCSCF